MPKTNDTSHIDEVARWRQREALPQSEERYRNTLNSMLEGCQIVDFDCRYVYLNDVAVRHGRRRREELLGHTMIEMYPGIENTEMFGYLRRCMEKRVPHRMENLFTFPDGSQGWFELSIEPIPEGIFILSWDITERKQAEDEIKRLLAKESQAAKEWQVTFASISDWVSVHDKDYRIVRANKAFAEALKMKSEEIIGKCCYEVIHGEKEASQYCAHREALKTKKTILREFFNPHLGIYMEVVCSPIFDEKGEITTTVHIARDITERKRTEEEREKLVQNLEATVKELEAFAYTISHDLRGPLHTIRSFAEALGPDLDRGRKDRVTEDVRAIQSGVDRMERLLRGILQYSRYGRMVQPTGDVLFGDIVREALEQLAVQISSAGATVSVAERFPAVYADRLRMVEALSNLIQNSIDYRNRSRPLAIEIGYRSSDGEAVFFVGDNGVGIDPAKREKIFELFYRGDKESKGIGAGLTIVKRIIEGHGGKIWVESEPGERTTICFTLPGAHAPEAIAD